MAEIKISHNKERVYVKDAINVYFAENEQVSSNWKSWLKNLQKELETDKDVITVEDTNNFLVTFYEMVLGAYLKDEFRRARNSPMVLNGFCYCNNGHFLSGWSLL